MSGSVKETNTIIFTFAFMTNFIPLFPLEIVVYPGESLNLNIFEPRYVQLINDCLEKKKPFGIPCVIGKKMQEMGTLVEIIEVSQVYPAGEMDIKTRGLEVFRILEEVNELPDKMYTGAIVNYPENRRVGNPELMRKVIDSIRQLHELLNTQKDFKKPDSALWSYDVAHHAGLSIEQEYELLGLFHELQREEYLKQHLLQVVPVVREMEKLKERIQLNGHFKKITG